MIVDRALQARVKNALEPEWEARFEPKSYGFRPGRGCHDAIEAIYQVVKGRDPKRLWVLDADLAAAFDRIDHDHLLNELGTFPARGLVRDWLTAGVIGKGQFAPTEEGTPQGGVISPLLLNVALHGMEQAAGVRYFRRSRGGIETAPDRPVLVRYADDLVALCHSREHAEQVKARLAAWLVPRGLVFNEDKTRIVHVGETGFDFLGFNVRRYHNKLVLIKPSPGGRETHPEKAAHRAACPTRVQRRRSAQEAHPDHPRVGRLLPDRGVERGVLRARRLHVEADLPVGASPPRANPTQHQISTRLWAFYRWCADTTIPELHRLAATIQAWWPPIEAFILTGITNAASEGINRLIKLEARNAFGFRNPINQRLRSRCASIRAALRPAKPG